MDTAEIIVDSIKRNRMAKVLNLLAESVRQAGKPSHGHPHREVLPFDIACRNVASVRFATNHSGCSSKTYGRAITPLGFDGRPVNLRQRGIVNISPKSPFDGIKVCPMSVCGQLHPMGKASGQIVHKLVSRCAITRSDKVRNGQLGIGVNSNPRPDAPIPKLPLFLSRNIFVFGIAKLPNFITLNATGFHVSHCAVVKFSARRSKVFQETKDCSFSHASHTARGTNGVPFNEGAYNGNLLGERESVHVQYYA